MPSEKYFFPFKCRGTLRYLINKNINFVSTMFALAVACSFIDFEIAIMYFSTMLFFHKVDGEILDKI